MMALPFCFVDIKAKGFVPKMGDDVVLIFFQSYH